MRQFNHSAPSGGHFSLTFFTGVALGVALGMLFAPSEGVSCGLSSAIERSGSAARRPTNTTARPRR